MRYAITIEFEADAALTSDERDRLMLMTLAQVEDPAGLDSDDKRARYSTRIEVAQISGGGFVTTMHPTPREEVALS
jgi:hypothetical protein